MLVSLDKISDEIYKYNENINLINELKKDQVKPIKFEDKISFK